MVSPGRVPGKEGAGLLAATTAAGQVAKIKTLKGSGSRPARKEAETC